MIEFLATPKFTGNIMQYFISLAVFICLSLNFIMDAEAGHLTSTTNTVTDLTTGLIWEKTSTASAMTWEQALAWCEKSTTGGISNWHLPNKFELETLVDDSQYNPAIDSSLSGFAKAYWASTTDPGYGDYAWAINFYDGNSDTYSKAGLHYVRCVSSMSPGNKIVQPSIMLLVHEN
ncbi:MAG: DUF1566 domain-containing protein [Solidesulfovibrio sp. DCME]|uniref:Lcl C-terminal domain-containing protein n=1 Tax=Solidesulfovibrio sp. DCME TaxID=3447380 RepID=UPI003D0E522F